MLLSDVVMPGITGLDLARHFHAQFPRIPILYMSGYTDDALEKHGLCGKAARVLQKPFTHDSLTRGVREALAPVDAPDFCRVGPSAEAQPLPEGTSRHTPD